MDCMQQPCLINKWTVCITIVSDISSSPKLKSQKIAEVKQIIAAWALTELKKKRRKMGRGATCNRWKVKQCVYYGLFLKLWGEIKQNFSITVRYIYIYIYIYIYMDSFEEMYVPIKHSLHKEDANMRKCILDR